MSKVFKGHTIIQGKDRQPVIDGSPMSLADRMVDECAKYERFSIEIKNTNPKTAKQCRTHWGLAIATIIAGFNDSGEDCSRLFNLPKPSGVAVTGDMLQQYFYALFPVLRDGKRITMSKMTTTEESKFYEQINAWASSQWNIYIPEPDPKWFEKKEKKCRATTR